MERVGMEGTMIITIILHSVLSSVQHLKTPEQKLTLIHNIPILSQLWSTSM